MKAITIKWANNTIREIREDIFLNGPQHPAFLILNRENGKIIDYSLDTELVYYDERWEKMPLFNVLCNFIAAAKNTYYERTFPGRSFWLTAARLVADKTIEEFARENDVSANSLRSWENGLRNPKLETLLKIAKKYNLPTDLIL